MPAIFKSYVSTNIGTSSVTVLSPSTKTIVIGLIVTNVYGSIMPVTLKLNKSGGPSVFLAKATRVEAGAFTDLMKGNKLVVEVGDTLTIVSTDTAAFDVSLSVLEGVS